MSPLQNSRLVEEAPDRKRDWLLSFRSDPVLTSDVLAVLTAASLPWSTTLVSIFSAFWILNIFRTLRLEAFRDSISRSKSIFPILLFLLVLIGTVWATGVSWPARLRGVNPAIKLLAIPFLVYHYQRSPRAIWTLFAFLLSCTVLMALSWVTALDPNLTRNPASLPGVPVKNYIDQSQSFALCAVVLAWPILKLSQSRQYVFAFSLFVLAIGFLANLSFVVLARTALVYVPIMLLFFVALHLPRSISYGVVACSILLAATAWFSSSNLQTRTNSIMLEYSKYGTSNEKTSAGLRLEYWRKSFGFFLEAPILGHGTGSVQMLFDRAAKGQTGLATETISNPHNQTLSVAVQWGVVGCVILFAMWTAHLLLFRGTGLYSWLGFIAVVQNIVSSLFNSHLFDFVPGWIYVISVSLAAGIILQRQDKLEEAAQ